MKKILIIAPLLGVLAFAYYFISSYQGNISSQHEVPSSANSFPKKITQNIQKIIHSFGNEKYKSGLIVPPKPKTVEEFVSGKTFWNSEYNDNRIYFTADKTATVQFFKNQAPFNLGDIISGKWNIKQNKLCFDLKPTIQDMVCYDATINYTKTGIPGYTDELILTNVDGGQKEYNRQAQGNLILDSSFAKLSASELKEMDKIRSSILNFKIRNQQSVTHDIKKLNKTNQQYFNTLFSNIMSAPITYMHFNKDGTYSSILKGDFEQYKNNSKELKKKVRHGKWWIIKNKYHCYGFDLDAKHINDRFAFCSIILPPSAMSQKENGFVTHSTHGFTMRHLEEKFIPINEFSHSDIFQQNK